jgi:hypothetical protein
MEGAEDCRAYVEHLHHEHARLNQLLLSIGHEVKDLSRATESADALTPLGQRFADLHRQLQSHFAEEETGGCLEEAVTRCPSLGDDCKKIVAEHAVLDGTLKELVNEARDPAAVPADLQQKYQAFADRILAHEAAENRILQMAFGADAADYDVEGVD